MNKIFALSGLTLALLPMASTAALAHGADKRMEGRKPASAAYQCQKCHMKASAATAKKDGYKDPMDGGKLLPVTAAPTKAAPAAKLMGKI